MENKQHLEMLIKKEFGEIKKINIQIIELKQKKEELEKEISEKKLLKDDAISKLKSLVKHVFTDEEQIRPTF